MRVALKQMNSSGKVERKQVGTPGKDTSRQGSPKPSRNVSSPRTGKKRDVEPKETHVNDAQAGLE